ncbi:hypothetical protein HXX76_013590 [Chlamydomonas incerta]|uniref:Uncharacterized protein n=1 Tax=Chlamydomonas incerta TaxID=51695 RepID=A0A835VUB3_CHLIN|nr:hypothetical protein HXX76_013590 [Chlamydomonas incerta]|eukprot:KAG2425546.1 hypothetical protein HXX76_013590 [Chlamydomonas incerta]
MRAAAGSAVRIVERGCRPRVLELILSGTDDLSARRDAARSVLAALERPSRLSPSVQPSALPAPPAPTALLKIDAALLTPALAHAAVAALPLLQRLELTGLTHNQTAVGARTQSMCADVAGGLVVLLGHHQQAAAASAAAASASGGCSSRRQQQQQVSPLAPPPVGMATRSRTRGAAAAAAAAAASSTRAAAAGATAKSSSAADGTAGGSSGSGDPGAAGGSISGAAANTTASATGPRLPRLRALCMEHSPSLLPHLMTADLAAALRSCTHLQRLEGLASLGPAAYSLVLPPGQADARALAQTTVAHMTQLRELRTVVGDVPAPDPATCVALWRALAGSLTRLEVSPPHRVSLQLLSPLTALRELRAPFIVADTGPATLTALTSLTALKLQGPSLPGEGGLPSAAAADDTLPVLSLPQRLQRLTVGKCQTLETMQCLRNWLHGGGAGGSDGRSSALIAGGGGERGSHEAFATPAFPPVPAEGGGAGPAAGVGAAGGVGGASSNPSSAATGNVNRRLAFTIGLDNNPHTIQLLVEERQINRNGPCMALLPAAEDGLLAVVRLLGEAGVGVQRPGDAAAAAGVLHGRPPCLLTEAGRCVEPWEQFSGLAVDVQGRVPVRRVGVGPTSLTPSTGAGLAAAEVEQLDPAAVGPVAAAASAAAGAPAGAGPSGAPAAQQPQQPHAWSHGAWLPALAALRLHSLSLRGVRLSGADVRTIAHSLGPTLEELAVMDSAFPFHALAELAGMPRLYAVSLGVDDWFPKRRELLLGADGEDAAAVAAPPPPNEDPDARFLRLRLRGYPGVPPGAAAALYDLVDQDLQAVDDGRKRGMPVSIRLVLHGGTGEAMVRGLVEYVQELLQDMGRYPSELLELEVEIDDEDEEVFILSDISDDDPDWDPE